VARALRRMAFWAILNAVICSTANSVRWAAAMAINPNCRACSAAALWDRVGVGVGWRLSRLHEKSLDMVPEVTGLEASEGTLNLPALDLRSLWDPRDARSSLRSASQDWAWDVDGRAGAGISGREGSGSVVRERTAWRNGDLGGRSAAKGRTSGSGDGCVISWSHCISASRLTIMSSCVTGESLFWGAATECVAMASLPRP